MINLTFLIDKVHSDNSGNELTLQIDFQRIFYGFMSPLHSFTGLSFMVLN